jgi:excisionase family DNA binding protein
MTTEHPAPRATEGACPKPALTPLLTITQAAEVLNVPSSWVEERVRTNSVPFTRIGKHVRFTEGHIAHIIAAGESPAPVTARPRHRPGGRTL